MAQTGEPYAFVNDSPLNASDPLGDNPFEPWTWSGKTWDVVGLVLGVVGAVTGVGAVVELAAGATTAALEYGLASLGTGIAASVIDGKNCSSTNRVACVGAALGATDMLTGLGGLATGSSVIGMSLTAFTANVGVTTSVFDVTVVVVNNKSRTSTIKTVKVKVVEKAPPPHRKAW